MSTENVTRITREFTDRLNGMDETGDRITLLVELVGALASNTAEMVFTKVQTEPGWTQETGQALADEALQGHILAITDIVHANGGTLQMAQDLGKAAAIAYGLRLKDLSEGYAQGGSA